MKRYLSVAALANLPPVIEIPKYAVSEIGIGIIHLGIGAFARAHTAFFTDEAIALSGGNWGIFGVSLRTSDVADALVSQGCLYTVETLGSRDPYRVLGSIRQAASAKYSPEVVRDVFSRPEVHLVTLTVTEKGYCLDANGDLDLSHPEVLHDLKGGTVPESVIGWICYGLAKRRVIGGAPLTIMSCDNLSENGQKLRNAVLKFAERKNASLARWIENNVSFPQTMVDCIVPASTVLSCARVDLALGCSDRASVQRERFAQWIIENKFSGPIPNWNGAGAQIVESVASYERTKLHVLNLAHSALAYMGLVRGHRFVRQAISDPELRRFVDDLIIEEVAPALVPLPVIEYWHRTRDRLSDPGIDHQLDKIADDGSLKLAVRLYPLLTVNRKNGISVVRLVSVVRAWLAFVAQRHDLRDPNAARLSAWARDGADPGKLLADTEIFPAQLRDDQLFARLLRGEQI